MFQMVVFKLLGLFSAWVLGGSEVRVMALFVLIILETGCQHS